MIDTITQIWDDNFSENSPLEGSNKVENAVSIANWTAASGSADTNVAGRTSDVCLDCVSGFMEDAGIHMPNTSSVKTFIDAMNGHKVRLWEHDPINMATVESDPKVWEHHKQFDIITNPIDLVAGDILVVRSHNGAYDGLHTTLVTGVNGTPKGFSMFTGVDVVHDKGTNYPITKDQYEWHGLQHGEGPGSTEGNRTFVEAYRYIGE